MPFGSNHLFTLTLRDIELILAGRGVLVSYETIRRWCRRFGANFAAGLCKRRPKPGDIWHTDQVLILSAKSTAAWQ